MRAALIAHYGPPEVVQLHDVPDPVPGPGELLVRITATTVNSGDARMRALRVPAGLGPMMRLALGFNGPRQKIGGFEAAGVVVSAGPQSRFKPGDRVVASHGFKFGLHAELAVFAETDAIARIPEGMKDDEAVALLFGGATALYFFRKGGLAAGQHILINGASGAVGLLAVQLARHRGAIVTAICSSRNAALVTEMGAHRVIAYDREDPLADATRYDLVMDNHGNMPFARAKALLKPNGRYLMVIGGLWDMLSTARNRRVVGPQDDGTQTSTAVYEELLALAASGVLKPVIDSTFDFARIADAHRRVDTGHKVGSVIVRVAAP